jgi:hypothetical protein
MQNKCTTLFGYYDCLVARRHKEDASPATDAQSAGDSADNPWVPLTTPADKWPSRLTRRTIGHHLKLDEAVSLGVDSSIVSLREPGLARR